MFSSGSSSSGAIGVTTPESGGSRVKIRSRSMSAIVTSRHVAGGFVPGVAPDRGGGAGGAEGVVRGWRRFRAR